ncbi:probable E3 ubiquitin-protein ligase RHC2A [Oryza brachyantha]|uniref:probable E3 ubiquitin-protein ligase RHC2A n=1 Tax=Oryza brachyantha TaxID=4533 RepID=UPI001ADC0FA1|nr:probable E3 ubiquitin-protein ligase RHC2A [Oryza brachyantha]
MDSSGAPASASASASAIDVLRHQMVSAGAGAGDLFDDLCAAPPARASRVAADALRDVDGGGGGDDCAICLDRGDAAAAWKETPCGHSFHGGCLEKWVAAHTTCPLCRHQMPPRIAEEGASGGMAPVSGVSFHNGRRARAVLALVIENSYGGADEALASDSSDVDGNDSGAEGSDVDGNDSGAEGSDGDSGAEGSDVDGDDSGAEGSDVDDSGAEGSDGDDSGAEVSDE